jgi:hypothetical protein
VTPVVLSARLRASENLRFENAKELFDFSETLVGDAFLADKKLKRKFLVNNYLVSKDGDFLILSEYIKPGPVKVLGIFNAESHYPKFRILICDLKNQTFYEQRASEKALHVKRVFNNKIIYYEAFHSNIEELKRVVKINDFNFKKIQREDVFE